MTLDYSSETRLRAIALNAVREAMLVYGRFEKQFTDDDAARIENIFQILHLSLDATEYEHASLVHSRQAEVTASARKIANLLADVASFDEPSNTIPEVTPIKIAATKSTTKVVAAE